MTEFIKNLCQKYHTYRENRKGNLTAPDKFQTEYLTESDWFEKNLPDVVKQSPEMVVNTYVYREDFFFQRLLRDQRWYVTFMNEIIAHGMYRHDLEEWIDTAYPQIRAGRTEIMPEIKSPAIITTSSSIT